MLQVNKRFLWEVRLVVLPSDQVDYIEMASQGNVFDFGNLDTAHRLGATANLTRGIKYGWY